MRFYDFRRILDDICLGFLFNVLSCSRRFLLSLYPPSMNYESRGGSQFIEDEAGAQKTQYPGICNAGYQAVRDHECRPLQRFQPARTLRELRRASKVAGGSIAWEATACRGAIAQVGSI
jgi:hypothetical protein